MSAITERPDKKKRKQQRDKGADAGEITNENKTDETGGTNRQAHQLPVTLHGLRGMVNNAKCACSMKLTTFPTPPQSVRPFTLRPIRAARHHKLGVQSSSPGKRPNTPVGRLARNFACVGRSGSESVMARDHARLCDSEILSRCG
ncbi:hypothetical protein MRX96_012577 [Rhipicephalus microplus]